MASNYVVSFTDTGGGDNNLTINGAETSGGQTFLVRSQFVAIVDFERVSGRRKPAERPGLRAHQLR